MLYEVDKDKYVPVDPAELKKLEPPSLTAMEIVQFKPFYPEQFHDTYAERVEQLIESKNAGKPAPKAEKGKRPAPVVDLMTAKQSLAGEKKSAGAAKHRNLRKTA
jgi:DNA end-binding protein Ku